MRFITAFGRNRIERQKYCLQSWRKHATEIVAVQTAEDIELLSPHFPGVRFVETDLTGAELYGLSNRVRIKALVDQGPGLLINSDIKVASSVAEFKEDWMFIPKTFSVGVRYDFDGPGQPKKMNKYGIDAFLISEDVMRLLPDIGFVIGVSVWDYWIVWHMMTKGFSTRAKITPGLLHLKHSVNWSAKDTSIGLGLMAEKYGIKEPKMLLDMVIPILTGRSKTQV